ncbi:MAG: TetR/AcrR family transcriptional regulator [Acidobacteriia bacterium]|nr:TetR/AcrR family transcriptional regulator [Terriglobia bacterium]
MQTSSGVRSRILEAAAELFGNRGPDGVTFHQLAKRARVTPGSIYRLFKTREMLFEQTVKDALSQAVNPANFLLKLFEDRKGRDFRSVVAGTVRLWYASLSQPDARLLMQATFMNHKWEGGDGPVEKIMQVLATGMERELKARKGSPLDATTAARALILSLFQLKLSLPSSVTAKQEKEIMESILQFWLNAIF